VTDPRNLAEIQLPAWLEVRATQALLDRLQSNGHLVQTRFHHKMNRRISGCGKRARTLELLHIPAHRRPFRSPEPYLGHAAGKCRSRHRRESAPNRPSFPGPRFVILREREAAFPAYDSGALRRIACHREFSLLGMIVRPFAISCQ
jgi:hypothetical protein